MKVETRGDGEPEISVVASQHGDEPCGRRAVEKVLESELEFSRPVKFVVANQEALRQGERYLDEDLNRAYPGDPDSDAHEERLAAQVLSEVKGTRVLDIHSTHSRPVPYSTFSRLNEEVVGVMRSAGVERGCHYPQDSGDLHSYVDGAIVETGPQGTERAAEMAHGILLNFLAAEGAVEADHERSDPELYRYFETVRGGDWEFLGRNFEKVETGEVFARNGSTELVTTEGFYPVLMSTDGYDHILGHKARHLGRASSQL
jgi:predicted deacylase